MYLAYPWLLLWLTQIKQMREQITNEKFISMSANGAAIVHWSWAKLFTKDVYSSFDCFVCIRLYIHDFVGAREERERERDRFFAIRRFFDNYYPK